MSEIAQFLNEKVQVLTADGRLLIGVLEGFDQTTNLILSSALERVFTADAPTSTIPLGLYLVRGDSVAAIGALDSEKDDAIDWAAIQAAPLKSIS